jgi:RND family efflux transporter MFP subunit
MILYKRVASLISVLLFASILSSCGGEDQQVEEIIRPVRYTQVYATGGSRVRTFSGAARSGVESNLSFKVAGTVLEVPVKVGDKVKAGQLVARLDPEDYKLNVQKAEAALAQARAQERKAKADYERMRALYENNNASKGDLDAARAKYESTRAQVESAEKQLDLARLQLRYTRLLAPVDGSIASVDVEVNENVQPGRRIVMLTAGSQIEVEVAIPEILIAGIRKGSRVTVKFDAIPAKSYSAIVREVGVASMGFATTFPVTVRLENADPEIRSGMAAEVAFRFESDDQRERFIVPSVAIGEDRQGRFVFVIEPTNSDTAVVKRVSVQVGELTAEGFEILSGLSDGDLVVTAGVSKITDGQKVKFLAAKEN